MNRILVCFLFLFNCQTAFQTNIQRYEAGVYRTGKLVKQGDEVELVCSATRPWFFCVWRTPVLDRHCAINSRRVSPACKNQRMVISGGEGSCSVRLKVSSIDHGGWTCMMTYDKDFRTQKKYVDLEVGLKPTVHLIHIREDESSSEIDQETNEDKELETNEISTDLVFNHDDLDRHRREDIGDARSANTLEDDINDRLIAEVEDESDNKVIGEYKDDANIIRDDEDRVNDRLVGEIGDDVHDKELVGDIGEVIKVKCAAHRAYPRPRFLWTVDEEILKSDNQQLEMEDQHYWVNSSEYIRLRLEDHHNNSVLTCTVRQYDKESGTVLYVTRKSTRIFILAPPVMPLKRVEPVVYLPVLLILLLGTGLLVCMFALPLCFRFRKLRNEEEDNLEVISTFSNLEIIQEISEDPCTPTKGDAVAVRYMDPSRIQISQVHQMFENEDFRRSFTNQVSRSSDELSRQLKEDNFLGSKDNLGFRKECEESNEDPSDLQFNTGLGSLVGVTTEPGARMNDAARSLTSLTSLTRTRELVTTTLTTLTSLSTRNRKQTSMFYCTEGCFRQDSPCQHSLESIRSLHQSKQDIDGSHPLQEDGGGHAPTEINGGHDIPADAGHVIVDDRGHDDLLRLLSDEINNLDGPQSV